MTRRLAFFVDRVVWYQTEPCHFSKGFEVNARSDWQSLSQKTAVWVFGARRRLLAIREKRLSRDSSMSIFSRGCMVWYHTPYHTHHTRYQG
eukprot:scaffold1564_cov174-Amphora_coffeaeformis.AAC.11